MTQRSVLALAFLVTASCATTADPAPERWESCEEWPHDPADPRVGFYLYERSLDDYWGLAAHQLYRFDGDTITMQFVAAHTLEMDCTYGSLDGLPGSSIRRFRAFVSEDGDLYALQPCHGWNRLGRFRGDRLETPLSAILRRVANRSPRALLSPPIWDEVLVSQFFRCHDVWSHPSEPVPRPPGRG